MKKHTSSKRLVAADSLSRVDRAKIYLTYLDKEMTIMGVLSAFCAAVLGLVLTAVVKVDDGKSAGAKIWANGHWFIVFGTIGLLSATLFFYRQRSHLAWIYGQISLAIALKRDKQLGEWLVRADGWDTWIDYRWGFGTVAIGVAAYALALISAIELWICARPFVVGFLLLSVVGLCVVWRITRLLNRFPQSEHPLHSFSVFVGLAKHPEAE